jgi:hypothetical protein
MQGSSESDQLYKTCAVLGTPTQDNWKDGLKQAASISYKYPRCNPKPSKFFISQNALKISNLGSPPPIICMSRLLEIFIRFIAFGIRESCLFAVCIVKLTPIPKP